MAQNQILSKLKYPLVFSLILSVFGLAGFLVLGLFAQSSTHEYQYNDNYTKYNPNLVSKAEKGKVLILFKAEWCSSCTGLVEDIESNRESIPEDTYIMLADIDKDRLLVKEYEVTMQHTAVQIDKEGKELKKWVGSPTLDELLAETV